MLSFTVRWERERSSSAQLPIYVAYSCRQRKQKAVSFCLLAMEYDGGQAKNNVAAWCGETHHWYIRQHGLHAHVKNRNRDKNIYIKINESACKWSTDIPDHKGVLEKVIKRDKYKRNKERGDTLTQNVVDPNEYLQSN
jgi:hypothetical protein